MIAKDMFELVEVLDLKDTHVVASINEFVEDQVQKAIDKMHLKYSRFIFMGEAFPDFDTREELERWLRNQEKLK